MQIQKDVQRKRFSFIVLGLLGIIMLGSLVSSLTISIADTDLPFTFKADKLIDLNLPVFMNDSSRATSSVNCNITMTAPNSTVMIRAGMMNFNASGTFNYTIPQEKVRSLGEYVTTVNCDDGLDFGFVTFSILINNTGSKFSTAESVLYIIVLAVSFLIFGLCLFGGIKIRWKNPRNEEGSFIGVNEWKHVKVFLLAMSYLLLTWITFLAWGITKNLFLFDMASGLFKWLFLTLITALFPIFVVSLILAILAFISDKNIKKHLARGIKI